LTILSLSDLKVHYKQNAGTLRAVDGVSLDVDRQATVGLVGESGCGKSSLGRAIIRLTPHTSGSIVFDGTDIGNIEGRALRPFRRRMQMIFQDPFGSLNPRQTIGRALTTPLVVHGLGSRAQRREQVEEILDLISLPHSILQQYPHEFSGGQRQRIAIARALLLNPDFIVCDEPVSALDVSIQAQILNLLIRLKQAKGLTYLFISHDLAVIKYMADVVVVMYLGVVVERCSTAAIWSAPKHHYTKALLDAAPSMARSSERRPTRLAGDLPSPRNPPAGCRFHTRCPAAQARCKEEVPVLREAASGHFFACHFPREDG
jgi:peptide/nickel transport system ATP-binding protein